MTSAALAKVQLIFDRRVSKTTPGRFRTSVITGGVVPSLHVDYEKTRIKQYHKQSRALRAETTINDTRDFGIGNLLKNLPALRQIGFQANRRGRPKNLARLFNLKSEVKAPFASA